MKDNIYKTGGPSPFEFNTEVAQVFDNMIARSVPGYDSVQKLVGGLAKAELPEGSTVLDIGCSTGSSLLAVFHASDSKIAKYIGLDNSSPMLDKCRLRLMEAGLPEEKLELQKIELEQASLPNNSLTCLNYTLQFLPPSKRLALLKKIFCSIEAGGFLVFSEKVIHEPDWLESLVQEQHLQFKIDSGYSATEVEKKKAALDNVLTPIPTLKNTQMLKEAGFNIVSLVEKHFSFCTWVCKKL